MKHATSPKPRIIRLSNLFVSVVDRVGRVGSGDVLAVVRSMFVIDDDVIHTRSERHTQDAFVKVL